jgi:hypothetical protein
MKDQLVTLLEQKEGLRKRRLEVNERIRVVKLELAKAKSAAYLKDKYMEPARYFKLETELTRLQNESQSLQIQAGKVNTEIRANQIRSFNELFIDLAKAELSGEQFEKLVNMTKAELVRRGIDFC